MAQLDRLLSVMISNRADELVLREDDPANLKVDGQTRPVTKALAGAQVVALLREIANPAVAAQLDAKAPVKFRYECPDGVFSVRAMVAGDKWNVSIVIDDKGDFQRRTGMFTPMNLPPEEAVTRPVARKSMKMAAQNPDDARAAMERLLRTLVSDGGSDLHLRVSEPPIIRKHGEMHRLENEGKLVNDELEGLLYAIMPERNLKEYHEHNDTDFAY